MTQLNEAERLIKRLEVAMRRVNIGAPSSFPLDKRAGFVLKRLGVGGLVTLEKPASILRAIRAIENHRS